MTLGNDDVCRCAVERNARAERILGTFVNLNAVLRFRWPKLGLPTLRRHVSIMARRLRISRNWLRDCHSLERYGSGALDKSATHSRVMLEVGQREVSNEHVLFNLIGFHLA